MAGVKSCLKPHAICCITRALYACLVENSTTDYNVFLNKQNCWKADQVIKGNLCAVNLMERGDTTGEEVQKKCDGESVCGTRNTLTIEIQVYAKDCDDGSCQALAVLGHLQAGLFGQEKKFYSKRFRYQSMTRIRSDEYSEDFTQINSIFRLEYDFVESKPWKVFR